jgi:hypothetical protein
MRTANHRVEKAAADRASHPQRCAAALAAMREAGNTQAADICSSKAD